MHFMNRTLLKTDKRKVPIQREKHHTIRKLNDLLFLNLESTFPGGGEFGL
jgi:hypothetical protein